ncbi:CLUMA_CG004151, isoform A [Clunio marinus]|uniref:CLUMA_CG004151, isoform A n=1 Tax=Clunio marinus TaxID=568069 RepID=A0A1J1HSA2_9DIPT|nr:CLUMA_CG004151, isoform A [Clunio marinus]
MQSVTVLTHHGRRQAVKVEPNKTVLWILEEVCKKFDFDPNNYDLKCHNKLLDLSQMFRFAGLPNNCTLEMVEAKKKRIEQDLTICVQLEDGSRVNGSFPSSTSLKDVITILCPLKSSEDQSPVVIYMRSEIFGDALEKTTLKSLGLSSGGRALIRLINTDPESLKVQANISAPLPQKPKEEIIEKEKPRIISNAGCSDTFQFKNIQLLKEEVSTPDKTPEQPMETDEPVKEEALPSKSTDEAVKPIKQLNHELVEESMEQEVEQIINILDSRGTIVFSLDSMQTSNVDLPDSFFELTESEVRKLYRDLKVQLDEIENKPLMTTELRKLEENKKILNQLSMYKSCAIRIQFPNRYVIQSKFSTVETVGVVMEFVKQFLIDSEMEFYLFTTPPKTILDMNTTLIESNCVPSALLHFGCDPTLTNDFLKPDLYEKLSTGTGASRVLADARKSDSSTSSDSAGPSNDKNFEKPKPPTNFLSSSVSRENTGAIPK